MIRDLGDFAEIWLVDFEFRAVGGDVPEPHCLVAREHRSGRTLRLWGEELRQPSPPYPIGAEALFVAYYASAELGCHRALGWPMPRWVLDLYPEFRNSVNGLRTEAGFGLLGALLHHGIPSIAAMEKEEMRDLAIRGGPFTPDERRGLLEYCETDVVALDRLLPAMAPTLDLPRALLRGRFMAAAAEMEWNGIPIDVPLFEELVERWDEIKAGLIETVDRDYGVFENGHFKLDLFQRYLAEREIPWGRTPSWRLKLDDDYFKEQARSWPHLEPLRQLRSTLSQFRVADLPVGSDGRNRALLSAFGSRSSRNQPSNAKFIFGAPSWMRGLVRPEPGRALIYLDFAQQEIAIAAALSGDPALQDAYRSGDVYLAFAKQAGIVPSTATAETHKHARDLCKACVLGTNYGQQAQGLGRRLRIPRAEAQLLLTRHRETYPQFWAWSDANENAGLLGGSLQTVFGWTLHNGANVNPRTLRNFPMQANGAEMMRLACIAMMDAGVQLLAPVHDAVLVETGLDSVGDTLATARRLMVEASEAVLPGFPLRVDAEVIRYPERFPPGKGAKMWQTVIGQLRPDPATSGTYPTTSGTYPVTSGHPSLSLNFSLLTSLLLVNTYLGAYLWG